MNNLEDLKEKIVFESKNIIETLSKITSAEELLAKKDLVDELSERLSFLKVLEKNEDYFSVEIADSTLDISENQTENEEAFGYETADEIMEEEVLFTNELNEFNPDEDEAEKEEVKEEDVPEVVFIDEELKEVYEQQHEEEAIEEEKPVEVSISIDDIEDEPELVVVEKSEEILSESEEIHSEEIQEESHIEVQEEELPKTSTFGFELAAKSTDIEETIDYNASEMTAEEHKAAQEKKFKLANIKGLKPVQSLFDEETLEATKIITPKAVPVVTPPPAPEPSLVKSNVPTNYMEAEKSKTEFRLDLNDKLAFTKMLFGGSQSELNETVRVLNSFKTLDEAKEYLSEMYYQRHWNKAEEYAQRLWSLVENKFL